MVRFFGVMREPIKGARLDYSQNLFEPEKSFKISRSKLAPFLNCPKAESERYLLILKTDSSAWNDPVR